MVRAFSIYIAHACHALACRYERCAHRHSWNANWLFTNSVIFRLQRHSDHHAHADKPYQVRGCMRTKRISAAQQHNYQSGGQICLISTRQTYLIEIRALKQMLELC